MSSKGVLLIFSLLLFSFFARASSGPVVYIVNGSTASVTEFSDFASLFYDRINYDGVYGTSSYCGATMLTPQYIMTAAHCIFDGNGSADVNKMLFLSVVPQLQNESDFPNGNIQRVMGSEYYYRSDYTDSSSDLWANDIAIIKLESALNVDAVNDVVKRPSSESYRGNNTFEAIGHGNTSTGFDGSDSLLKTDLTYVDTATCQSGTGYSAVTNKQICFTGSYNNANGLYNSTCSGDSGGPVYWDNAGTWYQVGITSFGPSTCGTQAAVSGVTSVFTEIYDYQTWINDVLAGSETANYVATDAKRTAYLSSISTTSSGDSGGGSLGWIGLLGLSFLAYFRKR